MALAISITPADNGWALRSSLLEVEQYFFSGGRAESAGRELAERLAKAGQAVELEIRLRDGALAGRIRFPAAIAA
jgi:hypothetical protein